MDTLRKGGEIALAAVILGMAGGIYVLFASAVPYNDRLKKRLLMQVWGEHVAGNQQERSSSSDG